MDNWSLNPEQFAILSEARNQRRIGNHSKALTLLESLLGDEHFAQLVEIEIAQTFGEMDGLATADRLFRTIEGKYPPSAFANYEYAKILLRLGSFPEARRRLEFVLEQKNVPDLGYWAKRDLALIEQKEGYPEQARNLLSDCITDHPERDDAWRVLFDLLLEDKAYDMAEELLESLVATDSAQVAGDDWKTLRNDLIRLFLDNTCTLAKDTGPGYLARRFIDRRIALIRTPTFARQIPKRFDHSLLPPASLAVLLGSLAEAGIHPYLVLDLSMEVHDNILSGSFDLGPFFDEQRIFGYIAGSSDPEFDRSFTRLLGAAMEIALLSLPECWSNDAHIHFLLALCRFLHHRSITTIVGGSDEAIERLVDGFPGIENIDCLVQGEGEQAVREAILLVDSSFCTRDHLPLVHKKHTRTIILPDFGTFELDRYRLNLGGQYQEHSAAATFLGSKSLILPINFIKGCSYRCAFCCYSTFPLGDAISPERLSDFLERSRDDYRPSGFLWLNCCLNVSSAYLVKLANYLIKRNINILWSDSLKAGKFEAEVFPALAEAGCIRIVFGMEAASQFVLDKIDKRTTPETISRCCELADNAGIWVAGDLICGLPHEREKDVESTITFIKANRDRVDRYYLNPFDLRRGSLLHKRPERYGITNIRVLPTTSNTERSVSEHSHLPQYGFDEKDGLLWADRKKATEKAYRKIRETIFSNGYPVGPTYLDEHLLFYCFGQTRDKSAVRRLYREIIAEFERSPYRELWSV